MNDKIMKAFAKMLEKTMNPMPNHCVECDKPTQETLCPECMDKEDDDLVSNCCGDTCSECHEHADTAISDEIFGDKDGKS